LQAVAALSATDAWAVGTIGGKTLTEHWNGKIWTRVPSPSPARAVAGNVLTSVATISASDAWAAGYDGNKHPDLALGRQKLDRRARPQPGDEPEFLGVAATSAHSAWAVGLGGGDHTLIVALGRHHLDPASRPPPQLTPGSKPTPVAWATP
jgi:hypothetical protein